MARIEDTELQAMGYKQRFDYSQYSHDNDVNVIPRADFKRLIRDTFKTITEIVRETYGPYGSTWTLNEQNQTNSTKDGYNTFEAIKFAHQYKQMVKLAIGKICARVNAVVGDGTTSCLLLAEKIFDEIDSIPMSADDERKLMDVFNDIEKFFNSSTIFAKKLIKPLNVVSLESVIMMASNHDKMIRDTIVKALNVKTDNDGIVTDIDNVIVQSNVEPGSYTHYDILHMPGKYRINVKLDPTSVGFLFDRKKVVVLTYDHNFTPTDWEKFLESYKETYCLKKPMNVLNMDGTVSKDVTVNDIERPIVLICATGFSAEVERVYARQWFEQELRLGRKHDIIFTLISGVYPKNEIIDMAAVTGSTVHSTFNPKVEAEEFRKLTEVSVFNNDCLCLYDVNPPVKYIEKLELDAKTDDVYSRRQQTMNRINALKMERNDTQIIITVPSTLEKTMLEDKFTDCLRVIESACSAGCVPNLLKYAHSVIMLYEATNESERKVAETITSSIEGLFSDVWRSKNPEYDQQVYNETIKKFYDEYDCSYDIIRNKFIDVDSLATSVQYDIEVVCATLEILKYLLTSRGLIFDSCLLQMHGDRGQYVPVE